MCVCVCVCVFNFLCYALGKKVLKCEFLMVCCDLFIFVKDLLWIDGISFAVSLEEHELKGRKVD